MKGNWWTRHVVELSGQTERIGTSRQTFRPEWWIYIIIKRLYCPALLVVDVVGFIVEEVVAAYVHWWEKKCRVAHQISVDRQYQTSTTASTEATKKSFIFTYV